MAASSFLAARASNRTGIKDTPMIASITCSSRDLGSSFCTSNNLEGKCNSRVELTSFCCRGCHAYDLVQLKSSLPVYTRKDGPVRRDCVMRGMLDSVYRIIKAESCGDGLLYWNYASQLVYCPARLQLPQRGDSTKWHHQYCTRRTSEMTCHQPLHQVVIWANNFQDFAVVNESLQTDHCICNAGLSFVYDNSDTPNILILPRSSQISQGWNESPTCYKRRKCSDNRDEARQDNSLSPVLLVESFCLLKVTLHVSVCCESPVNKLVAFLDPRTSQVPLT